jgi:hypothetical protein
MQEDIVFTYVMKKIGLRIAVSTVNRSCAYEKLAVSQQSIGSANVLVQICKLGEFLFMYLMRQARNTRLLTVHNVHHWPRLQFGNNAPVCA